MKIHHPILTILVTLAVTLLARASQPNIILCMADDHGWGDTGYNGHAIVKTPNLDQMAQDGIVFNRFYAAAPVCSPTRGSVLTGRHPYRYGIPFANRGCMKPEEVTLAEVLKDQGYATGHFGKWHLGTLTTEIKDGRRGGPGSTRSFSPPWVNGFDVCFSTESKVPTWDPMLRPATIDEKGLKMGWKAIEDPSQAIHFGSRYWNEKGQEVTENLAGDDSRVIMDRAIPFMQQAVQEETPFFMVIWFHAPHLPVVAGPDYAALYADLPLMEQNYYGCITALDEQMGRLRKELSNAGVAKNTLLFYCSDNGPENGTPGSSGGLNSRKRRLYEGGVRVPGLWVWPEKIPAGRKVNQAASTCDYFPTIVELLDIKLDPALSRPMDGTSLMPLINGAVLERPQPLGFESQGQEAWMDGKYKIYRKNPKEPFELYDLEKDPSETTNIAAAQPERVQQMTVAFLGWQKSCLLSGQGGDYPD